MTRTSPAPAVLTDVNAGATTGRTRIRALGEWAGDASVIIAVTTVVLFLIACLVVPEFATADNLRALLLSIALVGIAAVGMSVITIVGRLFSLSVSATVAVSTIIFAGALGLGPWFALVIAVAFGAVAGAVQGVLAGRLKADPIVTTIAGAAVMIGIAQIFSEGRTVAGAGDASVFAINIAGVLPMQVLIFLLVTGVAWWIHRFTVLGRKITLVGLNERAAEVSGLRSWPLVIVAFVASGALAGLAGALLASESGQGNLQLGATFGFDAITAVVVGGISVKGGMGNPLNAAVGAFLVGLLSNALVLVGLTYETQLIVKGVLVLFAIIITGVASQAKNGARR
ncbi:hypothetical protein B7R21_17425 [Subtercola boreus]|uniref:ABC transporter permease n=1 Tax=Subtercola boreus TaxID=120213 RepID=A0A3E0VAW9_9MICO|nr:ABC transporter permease [Subtercola boreus]RFA07006.1 hypothetical protein B7R21_17425 [Subtercola boreus]